MGSKSKTLALLLVGLFLISISTFQPVTVKAQTKTITVPDDYADIQTAINHANIDDIVFVRAGTYNYDMYNTILARPHSGNADCGIIINKTISLIGENKDTILAMNYPGGTAVSIQEDGVTFSGFTVTNNYWSKYGHDGSSFAFYGSNCTITNNKFYGSLVGTGYNANISYNTCEWGDNFGVVGRMYNSIISHNNITHNYLGGIEISDSFNVNITGNNITHNGVASYGSHPIEYAGSGISLTTYNQNVNANISIYQNYISSNPRFGIQFFGQTSNASIFNNNITKNGVGINLSNLKLGDSSPIGNGTKIFYNNLIGNGKNAYVYPSSLTSDKIHNSYLYGSAINNVSWDNGVVGNYWDDYLGNDSYIIDENNIDNHPLISPVTTDAVAPTPTSNSSSTGESTFQWAIPIISFVIIIGLILSIIIQRKHRKTLT